MRDQRIEIYTGSGSSNSWVWLADFLEEHGFFNLFFACTPQDLLDTSERSIIIIPGGDTFAIANAFKEKGLKKMGEAVGNGSIYIGICAGAYLPLRSSIHPLSAFNLLDMRIANISKTIPKGIIDEQRYSVPYGCAYIFHPARGPLRLTGERNMIAPLYGGPMIQPKEDHVRLRLLFDGLTDESEVLVSNEICKESMKGMAACVESNHGDGKSLLVSPHLEHPDYPEANEYFADVIADFKGAHTRIFLTHERRQDTSDLRRIIADLRVATSGIENRSWKIGIKYWESEKLLFFIEAVRKRLDALRKRNQQIDLPYDALISFKKALSGLKNEKQDDTTLQDVVSNLSRGASSFLNAYFDSKMQGI